MPLPRYYQVGLSLLVAVLDSTADPRTARLPPASPPPRLLPPLPLLTEAERPLDSITTTMTAAAEAEAVAAVRYRVLLCLDLGRTQTHQSGLDLHPW